MLLQVKKGNFTYEERPGQLLSDVSFDLSSGEILTVLGSNGAGKTTLIRNMLSLLTWSSGATILEGKPLSEWERRAVWQKIAYVPQAKDLTFSLRVKDMVLLGRSAHLKLLQQPGKKDRDLATEAMETIGIRHLENRQCNEISGGEMQMVLIARALCARPDILVLDEPESNLDFRNQLIVMQTVYRLSREQGIAAVINTHYPDHALRFSDKTLLLGEGGQFYFGPTAEVMTEERLRKIFRVDVKIVEYEFDGEKRAGIIPLKLEAEI